MYAARSGSVQNAVCEYSVSGAVRAGYPVLYHASDYANQFMYGLRLRSEEHIRIL